MLKRKKAKLSVIKYRKIVLDRAPSRFGFWSRRNSSEWDLNFISLPPEEQNTLLSEGMGDSYPRILQLLVQNHPLVEKGIAF